MPGADPVEAAGMARECGIKALWLPPHAPSEWTTMCGGIHDAAPGELMLMTPVAGIEGEAKAVELAEAGLDAVVLQGATPENVSATRERLELAGQVHTVLIAAPGGSGPAFAERSEAMADAESLREVCVHCAEAGADIVMIEPALPCLDVIRRAAEALAIPVAARMTELERRMLANASAQGWLDETAVLPEAALSIRRAGARFIVTPDAMRLAEAAS